MTDAHRWRTAVASGLILGLVVGIPYYSLPFFYDYFEHSPRDGGFGWKRDAVLLGLPLGTLATLVIGPWLARRTEPRRAVIIGALLCAPAVAGFGWMDGTLAAYYGLWTLYMVGWCFAGPMTHQLLLARVFQKNRGSALAIAFFGLSLFGSASVALLARPLTQAWGFRVALQALGGCVLLSVPVAWSAFPATKEQTVPGSIGIPPRAGVWSSSVFWRLTLGGTLTSAGIAGVNQHWKLILRERGFHEQARLDEVFGWSLMLMLVFSATGRFVFAWCADRFPKRHVITVAFIFMLLAMSLLGSLEHGRMAYAFAVLFGFGMSSDSLFVTLLAAERFGPEMLARAMALLIPVTTIGQTWFPYAVSLLWEISGSYAMPLAVVFVLILGGRMLLYRIPEVHGESLRHS
ncbi:MAG: hypothetical protein JNK48_32390 [Bryobacterales bacterium]|nr:hypothetical protein [Bryobacterales bacterium]